MAEIEARDLPGNLRESFGYRNQNRKILDKEK